MWQVVVDCLAADVTGWLVALDPRPVAVTVRTVTLNHQAAALAWL